MQVWGFPYAPVFVRIAPAFQSPRELAHDRVAELRDAIVLSARRGIGEVAIDYDPNRRTIGVVRVGAFEKWAGSGFWTR